MTKPDNFYNHAMETLTALDQVVPPGSHVAALALFDGELLYQTMHNHMHPVGTKYQQMYDFMNCLEENPCWGWLNSNATVRRISTVWSNQLNNVYQNISDHQDFKNFKFIFYSPDWISIFNGKRKRK
jgi:acyloxyacyl hydrolase